MRLSLCLCLCFAVQSLKWRTFARASPETLKQVAFQNFIVIFFVFLSPAKHLSSHRGTIAKDPNTVTAKYPVHILLMQQEKELSRISMSSVCYKLGSKINPWFFCGCYTNTMLILFKCFSLNSICPKTNKNKKLQLLNTIFKPVTTLRKH